MYGTFGAPQAVCEQDVIILFVRHGFAIQMRLPVFTCHQVVINTSQFDFRENNEACVYLLPTGLQQHAQFTIKTTTELVQFYSLNIENKEHHMLIVKMLTKKFWQSFFQFIQLGIRWLCRKNAEN